MLEETDGFCLTGAVQETFPSDMLRGQGADFLRWVALWSNGSSGLVRFCVTVANCRTAYDLASLFRGRLSSLERWLGKIAKRIGTRPSAVCSTVCFEGSLPQFFSCLKLSTSKIEEVSSNSVVLGL